MNDLAALRPRCWQAPASANFHYWCSLSFCARGRLMEVMPKWRFRTFDLSILHLGNRHIGRSVRVFTEFAVGMAPTLFQHYRPDLPS